MNNYGSQIIAVLPAIFICASIIAIIFSIALRRSHLATFVLAVIGLNAALISLLGSLAVMPILVTPMFVIDAYAVFFMAIILIAALACCTLAYPYLAGLKDRREEFYILLLCSALGGLALVASRHFASLFIGLELLSVPIYGMAAYAYRERVSLEAGLKYMVLSGAASSFLLFGMALLYAGSGSLTYSALTSPAAHGGALHYWLLMGVGMMVVGLGFKLSLVPFHTWAPDVYEGAPAPVSAYLATVSKTAVFAMLLRFFALAAPANDYWLLVLVGAIAFLSMLVGNLLALRQDNIKRLLGYSSIAHLGYLLTVIAAGAASGLSREATGVFLATYVATTLGAFGVIALVSSPYAGADVGSREQFRGLFWRRPYLAVSFGIMLLSLAGIPLTMGFIGEFFALAVAMQSHLWWLMAGIVVGSGIGYYYYMPIIVLLFRKPRESQGQVCQDGALNFGQKAGSVMIVLLAILVIIIGIYPAPLIALAHGAHIVGG